MPSALPLGSSTQGLNMYNKKPQQFLITIGFACLSALAMHSVKASNTPELGSLYNPAEQFKTAINLIEGQNTQADFSTGLKWLKLAAAQQYPQALYQLGFYYEYGVDEVERDYFKAVDFYEKAAKQGHLESQFNLSALLLRENTSAYNPKKGLYWLEQAARQEDGEAQYSFAMLLAKEAKTDPKLAKQSFDWLNKAARNGHRGSEYILGVKYLQGEDVKADYKQAFEWFQKAAHQGDAAAQFNTGLMYEQGSGVEQNLTRAIEWYEKAAKQGEAGAQFNLGNKYLFGSGVKEDTDKALQLIQASAKQGNPAAQTLLGNMLTTGKFLGIDYAKAYQLYLEAAENGYPEAQYQLSLMFAKGQGVEISHEQSVHWIKKAAQSNHALAQYGLGAYLANGIGIEKNLMEAAYWLSLAAAQGQRHAIESRDSVMELLTNEQLDTLKQRINTFSSAPQKLLSR